MDPVPTQITVRVLSSDAKIIGSLVGGCRVTIRDVDTGRTLARGLHLGGSGSTESIMIAPPERFRTRFDTPGTAAFTAEIPLQEPTFVEIQVEGQLACAHATQRASVTTRLVPGQHITGDGIVVEMRGLIVDIMTPHGPDVLRGHSEVPLEVGVRYL